MSILMLVMVSATIPEGWALFRYDAARTGFCPARANFSAMPSARAQWLVWDEGDIIISSPVGADFNGDNLHDVVIGSYGFSNYPVADVYRGVDGVMIWPSSVYGTGSYHGGPALMDVTGDGKPEVFIPVEDYNALYCLDGATGAMRWAYNLGAWNQYSSPLLTEEGDSGRAYVCDDNGMLFCLNATNGALLWSHLADLGGTCYASPAMADVNGDAADEIVYTCGNTIYVVSSSGVELWTTGTGDSYCSSVALCDYDENGDCEIWVYCAATGFLKVYDYGNSSPIMSVFVGAMSGYVDWPPPPAVADVNLDGTPDAVLHHNNGILMVDGAAMMVAWNTPSYDLYSPAIIANLDYDTTLEILVGGRSENYNNRCRVEMYQSDGSVAWRWDVAGPYNDEVEGEPILLNVDSDPEYEIAAVDYSCWTVILDGMPLGGTCENPGRGGRTILKTSVFSSVIELEVPARASAALYDVTGRQVGSWSLEKGPHSLDASGLARGLYLLRVSSETGTEDFKLLKAE